MVLVAVKRLLARILGVEDTLLNRRLSRLDSGLNLPIGDVVLVEESEVIRVLALLLALVKRSLAVTLRGVPDVAFYVFVQILDGNGVVGWEGRYFAGSFVERRLLNV